MSKAAILDAFSPVISSTLGASIGRALGKRKVKKMMSKGLINRLKFSIDPGLKKEIINKHVGVGSTAGLIAPRVLKRLAGLKPLLRTSNTFKPNIGFVGSSLKKDLKTMGLNPKKVKTKQEVKAAYRKQATKLHPDKGGNEEAFKALNATNQRIINSSWFDKLSHVSMAAMRDEMSEIVGKHKTAEANINKAWSSLAKTAFATAPLSTKPIDVNSKQPKITKNAGAPKGAKGPRVASMSTGKRADPLNPSPVTNA